MPVLEIIRNAEPAKLVRMGHAPVVITPDVKPESPPVLVEDPIPQEEIKEFAPVVIEPSPEPVKKRQWKPKKVKIEESNLNQEEEGQCLTQAI